MDAVPTPIRMRPQARRSQRRLHEAMGILSRGTVEACISTFISDGKACQQKQRAVKAPGCPNDYSFLVIVPLSWKNDYTRTSHCVVIFLLLWKATSHWVVILLLLVFDLADKLLRISWRRGCYTVLDRKVYLPPPGESEVNLKPCHTHIRR